MLFVRVWFICRLQNGGQNTIETKTLVVLWTRCIRVTWKLVRDPNMIVSSQLIESEAVCYGPAISVLTVSLSEFDVPNI